MLDKFISKRIDKRLEKAGFTKVPTTWLETFSTIGKNYEGNQLAFRTLAAQYNQLLEDYVKLADVKDLTTHLRAADIKSIPTNTEELAKLYIETYKVTFEDEDPAVISNKERKTAKPQKKQKPTSDIKQANKKEEANGDKNKQSKNTGQSKE